MHPGCAGPVPPPRRLPGILPARASESRPVPGGPHSIPTGPAGTLSARAASATAPSCPPALRKAPECLRAWLCRAPTAQTSCGDGLAHPIKRLDLGACRSSGTAAGCLRRGGGLPGLAGATSLGMAHSYLVAGQGAGSAAPLPEGLALDILLHRGLVGVPGEEPRPCHVQRVEESRGRARPAERPRRPGPRGGDDRRVRKLAAAARPGARAAVHGARGDRRGQAARGVAHDRGEHRSAA